jgi:hypothetical protein
MSRRQEVLIEVYSRIFSILRSSFSRIPAITAIVERLGSIWIASSLITWLAFIWINILEVDYTRSKEITILNIIE